MIWGWRGGEEVRETICICAKSVNGNCGTDRGNGLVGHVSHVGVYFGGAVNGSTKYYVEVAFGSRGGIEPSYRSSSKG